MGSGCVPAVVTVGFATTKEMSGIGSFAIMEPSHVVHPTWPQPKRRSLVSSNNSRIFVMGSARLLTNLPLTPTSQPQINFSVGTDPPLPVEAERLGASCQFRTEFANSFQGRKVMATELLFLRAASYLVPGLGTTDRLSDD